MENVVQGFFWSVGGWLMVRSQFSLRAPERLVSGIAAGFVLFSMAVNLFSPGLGVRGAGWAAALLLAGVGLIAAWCSRAAPRELATEAANSWPQLAWLAGLTTLFAMMLSGASIFDEYAHLPLVSTMAAGDIPPHFYLDPARGFAYHYGLHIFAAGLTASGTALPWSAWDLARGLALALTVLLGWLWVRRWTGSGRQGVLGSLALVFGGGARWLMLFLPPVLLGWMDQGLPPLTSPSIEGPNLVSALANPWKIDGLGSLPIPFAYHNGLFSPVSFSLGGSGAMAYFTTLLVLLLARPAPNIRKPAGLIILAVIFSSLALSAEHFFAFWWAAVALALALSWLRARKDRIPIDRGEVAGWLALLAGAALLSLVQGGFITETARGWLARLAGSSAEVSNLYGFRLRWPPALTDIHLGELSILNPQQLLILLFELGPVLLLAPLALCWGWKALRRSEAWSASLSLSALLLLGFALFFEYGLDVQMYRLVKSALWAWLVLGVPVVGFFFTRVQAGWKALIGLGWGAVIFAGVMLAAILLTTTAAPKPSYYLDELDAEFSAKYWNHLEPNAQVFDPVPFRAVTLFGRAARAYRDFYAPYPDWDALLADPLPSRLNAARFTYVYVSESWWKELSPSLKTAFQAPCVRKIAQLDGDSDRWRSLLDIRDCK